MTLPTYQDLLKTNVIVGPSPRKNYPNRKLVRIVWPDIQTMQAMQAVAPTEWTGQKKLGSRKDKYRQNFTGTPDVEAALKLANYGWPEGSIQAQRLVRDIFANLPLKGSRPALTPRLTVAPVGGVILNPIAFPLGLPTPFIGQFDDTTWKKGGKHYTIGVNAAVSCGVSRAVQEGRAACIASIAMVMLRMGYSVGLKMLSVISTTPYDKFQGADLVIEWDALKLGGHFNLDRLVFLTGHPSLLRRLCFNGWEFTPREFQSPDWMYCMGWPTSAVDACPQLVGKCDLFVDSDIIVQEGQQTAPPIWTDPQEQVRWVRTQLEAQGIIFTKGK